ncbi:MAG TPA: cytochrome b/b6 domain-containing protein [Bacteroidota bacterium]|nr:cytochrome b/b6 domain-containing protein [Bacteroidota bacterium]
MTAGTQKEFQHPFVIRLTHWINFLALGLMVFSGLRIYNASPLFSFAFPEYLTMGGWLAGARQLHFFAMWVFVLNGSFYFLYNVISHHGRKTTLFRGSDIRGIFPMILYYLRVRKEHPPQEKYNALQKLAYTLIPLVAFGAMLSGVAIYWPVQWGFLTRMLGGYDYARGWHFLFMAALVLFFFGHIVMVVIAGWHNFLSMFTGWKKKPG